MRITLKLVPTATGRPRRQTVAWFVPGQDPQTWLSELRRGEFPLDSIVLRPIPQSRNEATPLGVLVTQESGSSPGQRTLIDSPARSSLRRSRPYGQVGDRLFLPVDACFIPEIDDRDLQTLLPNDDCEFVWHPVVGLVRIEANERLRVVDLLTPPRERSSVWNCAVEGNSFCSRLVTVEADVPLKADDFLLNGADDIGTQQASPDGLPPTPDEWLGGKLNQWTKPFRDALKPLPKQTASGQLSSPPKSKGGSKERDRSFAKWLSVAATQVGKGVGIVALPFAAAGFVAGKVLKAIGARSLVDQIARNREIDRLMHLLKTDPDEGLKFALPLDRGRQHRGLAIPGNQLVAQNTGFSLDRLAMGGPADPWDIDAAQRHQLIQQYRELATRELRLGRHRRAAYIFGALLGDNVSAAGALESGRHYREAAALYRDRLKRPAQAANCLERAGLLDEAALIYLEISMLEAAADLYIRLENRDKAEELLRSHVETLLGKGDFQSASRVLHDKLHDVDGALAALGRGWPSSPTARSCLEEMFVMLGMHARHDEAQRLLADLRLDPKSLFITRLAAGALSNVAIQYPDVNVRAAAADTTHVVVARALPRVAPAEAVALLESIRRLAPQDRLLTRDCDRYVRSRDEAARSKPQVVIPGVRRTRSARLSLENTAWRTAKSADGFVYVAGFDSDSLVLQRLLWSNLEDDSCRFSWRGVSDIHDLTLDPSPRTGGPIILHPLGADPIERVPHAPNPRPWMQAGSPNWATKSTVALAYGSGDVGWRITASDGTLELTCISKQGEPTLFRNLAIPFISGRPDSSPVTLIVLGREIRIGVGRRLYRPQVHFEVAPIDFVTLEDDIKSLNGFQLGTNTFLIALFETGGLFVDDVDHEIQNPMADDLESPTAAVLKDARIVVAGLGEVQVYDIVHSRPVKIGTCPLSFAPISVTATNALGEFAVFGRDGEIEIFTIDV